MKKAASGLAETIGGVFLGLFYLALIGTCVAAYINHLL